MEKTSCPRCGTVLDAGKNFCTQCGARLGPGAPAQESVEQKLPIAGPIAESNHDRGPAGRLPEKTSTDVELAKQIRRRGVGMIALGALHIVLSGLLDPIWGIALIFLGVLNLLFPKKGMLVLNGLALCAVGVFNIIAFLMTFFDKSAGVSIFWVMLGWSQIGWGIEEVRKFFSAGQQRKQPALSQSELLTDQRVVQFYRNTMAVWASGKLSRLSPGYVREGKMALETFANRQVAAGGTALLVFLTHFPPRQNEFLVGVDPWFVLTNLRLIQKDGVTGTFGEVVLSDAESYTAKQGIRGATITFQMTTGEAIRFRRVKTFPNKQSLLMVTRPGELPAGAGPSGDTGYTEGGQTLSGTRHGGWEKLGRRLARIVLAVAGVTGRKRTKAGKPAMKP